MCNVFKVLYIHFYKFHSLSINSKYVQSYQIFIAVPTIYKRGEMKNCIFISVQWCFKDIYVFESKQNMKILSKNLISRARQEAYIWCRALCNSMSNKCRSFMRSEFTINMGQDFSDIQYDEFLQKILSGIYSAGVFDEMFQKWPIYYGNMLVNKCSKNIHVLSFHCNIET